MSQAFDPFRTFVTFLITEFLKTVADVRVCTETAWRTKVENVGNREASARACCKSTCQCINFHSHRLMKQRFHVVWFFSSSSLLLLLFNQHTYLPVLFLCVVVLLGVWTPHHSVRSQVNQNEI